MKLGLPVPTFVDQPQTTTSCVKIWPNTRSRNLLSPTYET